MPLSVGQRLTVLRIDDALAMTHWRGAPGSLTGGDGSGQPLGIFATGFSKIGNTACTDKEIATKKRAQFGTV
jgi:hypothetical protein